MLYYLRQEVIGDQAERILEGADSRSVKRLPLGLSRASLFSLNLHSFPLVLKLSTQLLF